MTKPTHTPETSNTPTAFGYCSWHDGHARGVRLIQAHEQGSGPGGGAFACHSCRIAYDLVPFADRPLPDAG
uniref:Uncharacterized protein n=1 Tax=Streptomyces sp. NBC_00093 TaxID=2975649 RepID=A0AAU2A1F0_9ACTN